MAVAAALGMAGCSLTPELEARIRSRVRTNATPRHVPARIVAVSEIPRTRSGKIVELAVRDVVHGRDVRNLEALANPENLTKRAAAAKQAGIHDAADRLADLVLQVAGESRPEPLDEAAD